MSNIPLQFELSSDEMAFLKRLALHDQSLNRFLSRGERLGTKYDIKLTVTEADQLRDCLTELLAKVGFGEDYSPNQQGELLEALIDRFHSS